MILTVNKKEYRIKFKPLNKGCETMVQIYKKHGKFPILTWPTVQIVESEVKELAEKAIIQREIENDLI